MSRVVDQRAIQLLTGHSGLHEIGIRGKGQLVALVDDDVTSPELDPWVARRLGLARRPTDSLTHGDSMARTIVQAAPEIGLVVANVFDRRARVSREAIASGLSEVVRDEALRLINVSLEIRRRPAICSPESLCVACQALRDATALGRIVVVAVGNRGEIDGEVTCPAAAGSGLVIGATTGPPGTSGLSGDQAPESGTSISAALVTAGCALLLSAFPDLELAELKEALRVTATGLPNSPPHAVGHGRAHFYRSFVYLSQRAVGATTDVERAETIAHRAVQTLGTNHDPFQPIATAGTNLDWITLSIREAVSLAPWSAELHYWLGLVLEKQNRDDAIVAVAEGIRLDWGRAESHALLSRLLLDAGDVFGATAEMEVALQLQAGQVLTAADVLIDALRRRSGDQSPASEATD